VGLRLATIKKDDMTDNESIKFHLTNPCQCRFAICTLWLRICNPDYMQAMISAHSRVLGIDLALGGTIRICM